MKEETNISIVNILPLSFAEDTTYDSRKKKVHYYFHYFKTKPVKGYSLKPGDDIAELRWFSKTELKKIPLPKKSIELFKKIGYL